MAEIRHVLGGERLSERKAAANEEAQEARQGQGHPKPGLEALNETLAGIVKELVVRQL